MNPEFLKILELAPIISENADQAERERRLARSVVDALIDAGIFKLLAPPAGDNSLASLLTLVDCSRILFGTDYPFMVEAATEAMTAELKSSNFLKPDDLRAIENANARKLFARD